MAMMHDGPTYLQFLIETNKSAESTPLRQLTSDILGQKIGRYDWPLPLESTEKDPSLLRDLHQAIKVPTNQAEFPTENEPVKLLASDWLRANLISLIVELNKIAYAQTQSHEIGADNGSAILAQKLPADVRKKFEEFATPLAQAIKKFFGDLTDWAKDYGEKNAVAS